MLIDGGYRENIGLPEANAILREIQLLIAFAKTPWNKLPPIEESIDETPEERHRIAEMTLASHVRARKLLYILERLQVHILAITSPRYQDLNASKGSYRIQSDQSVGGILDELTHHFSGLLVARENRTREYFASLDEELTVGDPTERQRCEDRVRRSEQRQGPSSSSNFLIRLETRNPMLGHDCEDDEPRHTMIEASLQAEGDAPLPALGWVLTQRSHAHIEWAAKEFASQGVDSYFVWSKWFNQLTGNLCGGPDISDFLSIKSFSADGIVTCMEGSRAFKIKLHNRLSYR